MLFEMNRYRKLKRLGCIKYKNGKSYIDKKKLDEVTGYIPSFEGRGGISGDCAAFVKQNINIGGSSPSHGSNLPLSV